MRRKRRHKRKKTIILITLLIVFVFVGILYKVDMEKKNKLLKEQQKKELILSKYSNYALTKKDSEIFELSDNNLKKVGTIGKDVGITLGDIYDEYYEITNLDGKYYIWYDNVEGVSSLDAIDSRYKKYIVFNENVVTSGSTNFYNNSGKFILSLNKSIDEPIIMKTKDYYGIEYSNQLLFIRKDEVTLKNNDNTSLSNAKGVPVFNYHFVYKDDDKSCDQIICISESNFRKHLDYIRDNNYFTVTAEELEMYIDGVIQLPKSVLITFDDGPYFYNARRILNEYKLNGTYFFVTVWMQDDLSEMESEFVELHSHTHDMHRTGKCPGGQGGGIKCLSEEFIQNDLKTSREKLKGSTYLAYPFYEYNSYSIEQLKKAGFTMAFGGYYENGYKYVKPGIDKFKLPRLVIYNQTSVSTIKSYLTLQ